jgi:hypothetical protein
MKMEIFKQKCREILQPIREERVPEEAVVVHDDDEYRPVAVQEPSLEGDLLNTEVVDIITAYKSLKLAMSKNVKGLGDPNAAQAAKGYLKPTLSSKQA